MAMTVSDFVASFLYNQGVRHVFEVSGGMITFLLDSLYRNGQIKVVSVHHEQAAAFSAEGLARMNGIPGIALATSGPGAINLLTGVGNCYFDSTPAVFITGQVNRSEQKGERAIRQLGFQEADIVSMAEPVTKAAWRVRSSEELPQLLTRAFALALAGRPGPVLLDVPMDVQRSSISTAVPSSFTEDPPHPEVPAEQRHPEGICDPAMVDELLAALQKAQRPLILAGGGIRASRTSEQLRQFVRLLKVPVVHSLMAVDALPSSDPQRVGMIGTYGNRWANLAAGRADFLLVLGSRLDIRQTGSDVRAFQEGRTIYHVDCEAGEVNNRVTGCRAILTLLRSFFDQALRRMAGRTFSERPAWLDEIAEVRRAWPDTAELKDVPGLNPNELMRRLSGASAEAAAFIADVGQHQMWAAQSLQLNATQRFLTSGGMGAMGSGLPLAIGASFSGGSGSGKGAGGLPVVLIAGDGGFQLNIQELQTIVRNRLPVKMVVLNNLCHGMVRQFQETYLEKRYQSTYWGYSAPDFARIAAAYGISSATVEENGGLAEAFERLWRDPQEAFLLQAMISPFANVYPKIAFGRPMTEMEPFAQPVGMEST